MSDLESATNDELIAELLRRSTFRGVLLYQLANFKGTPEDAWRWEARNCSPTEIIRLVLPQIPEDV